ncbi:hypothetical protein F3Y22_tig00000340pilonHSYRG00581 [Hibiscus syriacus]|uniref:C2H2-type domain-containing protein n=1 Tax=Hibiscus syriacus TaxID=106335 RepID=A0A6A3D4S4_HIBSY|nr:zinc finger protein AZF3-like [Hibiscus syriacus]KAE8735534.1 hypothetical protein F3Y22_tig00000340pilonHSYRG00581 [Hibiscus syriacus]
MKHSPEEDRSTCFYREEEEDCKERFPTMKLFCQHMKSNHRQRNSSGIRSETETNDIPKWSRTVKRTRRQTAAGYEFSRVYYGSLVLPQLEEGEDSGSTQKKQKTGDTRRNRGALMAFSESGDNYECESISSRGRMLKNPRPGKAVKSVHRCEICGNLFGTGQALGGHKTSHRVKVW